MGQDPEKPLCALGGLGDEKADGAPFFTETGGLSGRSGSTRPYGMELVLDLHGCDVDVFNRVALEQFFEGLCDDVLKMERHDLHFWDDECCEAGDEQIDPRTKGITAVQFIMFSNVTLHCLELLGQVYINIFSCKTFNSFETVLFCRGFFSAAAWRSHVLHRG